MAEALKRKNQFIIVPIIAVLLCIALIYFFLISPGKKFPSAAMALPTSGIVIYKGIHPVEGFEKLKHTDLFHFLATNESLQQFDSDLHFFDSLLNKSVKLKNLLGGKPLFASVHLTGSNNFDMLFLLQTEEKYTKEEYYNFFKDLGHDLDFYERNYEGTSIYDVKDVQKNDIFSFSLIHGILAISKNASLVEDALSAFKQNSHKASSFIEAAAVDDQKEKLFINFKNLGNTLAPFVNPKFKDLVLGLKDYLGVGAYAFNFDNESIQLDGTCISDEQSFLPEAFKEQKEHDAKLLQMLPARCAMALMWNIQDFAKYEQNYLTHKQKDPDKTKENTWTKFLADRRVTSASINKIFKGEWAYWLPEISNSNDSINPIFICKVDTLHAGLLDSINQNKAYIQLNYKNYAGLKADLIHASDFKILLNSLFGSLFSNFDHPYYTRIGEYLVWSNSSEGIISYINLLISNQPLNNSIKWKAISDNLPANSNFTMFINPPKCNIYLGAILNSSLQSNFKNNTAIINGLDAIYFGLNAQKSTLGIIRSNPELKKIETVWEMNLENEIASIPQCIVNADKSESLFITDKENIAYLLNTNGKLLWKKQLDAPLSGSVVAIDLLDNDESKYLFASKNTLYMLDKDGKDVGNYPLHLGSRSTSGVAIFDFNNNKNYNFFVGTQNNRIYGYYGNGKPLPGWNPQIIDAPLVLPLQSFQFKDDTYLLGVSNRGTVYVWRPNGDKFIKPVELKTKFTNPFKIQMGKTKKNTSFASIDSTGTLHRVNLEREISEHDYSIGEGKVFYDEFKSDSNAKNLYLIANKNTINAYDKDKKKWKLKVDYPMLYPPSIYTIQDNIWIGYVAPEKDKIYLSNTKGKLYKGFPIHGNMPFILRDFNQDGSILIFTVSKNKKLIMYRL